MDAEQHRADVYAAIMAILGCTHIYRLGTSLPQLLSGLSRNDLSLLSFSTLSKQICRAICTRTTEFVWAFSNSKRKQQPNITSLEKSSSHTFTITKWHNYHQTSQPREVILLEKSEKPENLSVPHQSCSSILLMTCSH